VTVGRFRRFVTAWNNGSGFTPAAGSGKHAYLNGGQGLTNSGAGGGFETGWSAADDANVAPTAGNLACGGTPSFATWTGTPAGQENKPVNCVNWYEAYAFCIWDGGFLPSEAEWEYAAAGGSQERQYPWGTANPGTASMYAIFGDYTPNGPSVYNCYYPSGTLTPCAGPSNIAPVGTAASGAGRWGQLDLVGELFEWNLDWYGPSGTYTVPCIDCAYLAAATYRVNRGCAFANDAVYLDPRGRNEDTPDQRSDWSGFRCARAP
jgi:formylglycine-generating enzyme required for sulfatase activity